MEKVEKELLILGYGYLGRFVAQEALSMGWGVRGVTRNQERLDELSSIGGMGFKGNVEEEDWHAFADTGVDFVLNCVSSAGNGLEGYQRSYVEGNESLVRWIEGSGFKGRALYTSSVSVYPDAKGTWLDEDSELEPETERGRLMKASEDVFLGGRNKAEKAVLRLGGIYGPERTWLLQRLKEAPDTMSGRGDYYLNLARVEDMVSAIVGMFCAKRMPSGVFNVIDDEPSLKEEIVNWASHRIGITAPRFSNENSSATPSHRNLDGRAVSNRRIRNGKLKEFLGWSPRFSNFRLGFEDLL